MSKPKGLSALQARATSVRLKAFVEAMGSQRRAAVRLGISNQSVSSGLAIGTQRFEIGEGVVSALATATNESLDQWVTEYQNPPPSESKAPVRTVEVEERYPIISEEFEFARAHGLSEHILNAARIALGIHRGDGPTREQVREAIAAAQRNQKSAGKFYREALDLDDET